MLCRLTLTPPSLMIINGAVYRRANFQIVFNSALISLKRNGSPQYGELNFSSFTDRGNPKAGKMAFLILVKLKPSILSRKTNSIFAFSLVYKERDEPLYTFLIFGLYILGT